MANVTQPIDYPLFSARNSLGLPLVNGQLFSYAAGTTTPQATYTDSTGVTANTNPVILNARGEAPVWLAPDETYKFVLEDQFGNQIWTADNVPGGFANISDILNTIWPQTAAEAGAGVTPVALNYPPGDIRRYGAQCNGSTDDSAAITTAMSCNGTVTVPNTGQSTFCNNGITIPGGVTLQGAGMLPNALQWGCALQFSSSVSVCVTMTAGSNTTASIRDISIVRSPSVTPAAGSTGLFVNQAYNVLIENVFVYNHARGLSLQAVSVNGLGANVNQFYAGGCSEAYIYVDSWPELRMVGGRIGMDVSGDVAAQAYIKVTGTSPATGGIGPNSLIFTNVQFNTFADVSPSYAVLFNSVAEPAGNTVDYKFVQCHFEQVQTAFIGVTGSGSANTPNNIGFTQCFFVTAQPMFAFPSSFVMSRWIFDGCYISTSTFAPACQGINSLVVSGNSFSGCAVTYDPPAGANWTVASTGNVYENGCVVTLEEGTGGGGFQGAIFADAYGSGPSSFVNNTIDGTVTIANGGGTSIGTWTPVLNFGGATTGITYSSVSGAFQVVGNLVYYQWKIVLSSVGSATGNATITGFPIFSNAGGFQTGGAGLCSENSGMSGLTGPVICTCPLSGPPEVMSLQFQGATGSGNLTNSNFTNASNISGSVLFFR